MSDDLNDAAWAYRVVWPCGHNGTIMSPHSVTDHKHFCPVCQPGFEECNVEYLDVHLDLELSLEHEALQGKSGG